MKINCEYCKKEFDKPNFLIKKSKHHFCSRKCGCLNATNLRWKNHVSLFDLYKCSHCKQPRDYRCKNELCQGCINKQKAEKNKLITLGELKQKHNSRKFNMWYSAEIRNYTKAWNSNLVNLSCQKCGYSLHSEMCHVKAIKDFDNSTTLGEINHPSNIIILCPNHHWEFDNGLLQLNDIPQRKEI